MFESQTLATCDRLAMDGRDLYPHLKQLALNIIGLATCGINFDEYPHARAVINNYTGIQSLFVFVGMLVIPGFMQLPLPEIRRRCQIQETLRSVITKVIEAKAAAGETAASDFLDVVVSTIEEAIAYHDGPRRRS
ncbi:Aste57867_12007 [Aphanomyces stellatus]|uniref:Aste57867_12007 protein n=1 Tax=Aphanomyces stellatus TaxID=120398 RepID=A0A485KWF5_9STRA|nr:hypothetical protein As57867_011962 [Aphanomyces stellatus]VFT88862.1 Aste57867_12007 [Aphanomyces stellatus]